MPMTHETKNGQPLLIKRGKGAVVYLIVSRFVTEVISRGKVYSLSPYPGNVIFSVNLPNHAN